MDIALLKIYSRSLLRKTYTALGIDKLTIFSIADWLAKCMAGIDFSILAIFLANR